MIAAIDMSPYASIGIGGLLIGLCAWYWQHLGKVGTSPARRSIRRGSLVIAVLAVFALVRAASFVDSEVHPANYVNSWLAAIGLLFLFMVLIGLDLFNSFLVYRRLLAHDMILDARTLQSHVDQPRGPAAPEPDDERTE
ncbi:MAG: hypothetical protein VXY94_01325 [Planctomycetota bacterium]|nr:hypothetical protein [Planctomycetota bacterium]MEC8733442.1 hypothetical protein [Planctomycetota bacterium]MEC9158465.1 hypothetical protein [Planctomycetota bacterium]MED5506325.1 hypothetical protein [Planctomycetota bacterium]